MKKADIEITIMSLVKKESSCRHVESVTVLDVPDEAANWKAAFGIAGAHATPSAAWQVVRSVQAGWDCDFG